MKNLGTLNIESLLFSLVSLWKVGQSITSNISFFLAPTNQKVKLKKLLNFSNLLRAQILNSHKWELVIIFDENINNIFIAFQIVATSFENFSNNSLEILIMSLYHISVGTLFFKTKLLDLINQFWFSRNFFFF